MAISFQRFDSLSRLSSINMLHELKSGFSCATLLNVI